MSDAIYMQRCLQLAQQGKGYTAPNPMVGAVLVHNGRVIGEGWHHEYGKDHAEVDCLSNVAPADRHLVPDSTMYVSLEPCAHYGNTPPCADRIVQERIKEVVIANTDPFARVSGKGIAILQNGGVSVRTGVLEHEGAWVNRRFFCFHSLYRPYIILKWAQTADGFIAPADRSRLQITGAASQQLLHKWRTEEAAIMVGTTTALNDNPQLTARLHQGRQPLRIVLDRNITLPRFHNLHNHHAPTWVVNEVEEQYEPGRRSFIKIPFDKELLPNLMSRLHEARILSVIIEGGAMLLGSFISAGLWDEARIFTGGHAINEGIAAPLLNNETAAMSMAIGEDRLNVFVHNKSAYPYVAGMEL